MHKSLSLVAIECDADDAGYRLINRQEYSASEHTLFTESDEASTAPTLLDVDGIAKGRAAKLESALGITDLDGLLLADAEQIAETLNVSAETVQGWLGQAEALLAGSDA